MSGAHDDGAASGAAGSRTRRRLRAVFAADVAGYTGRVAAEETRAVAELSALQKIARETLDAHDGWLFGMPGDGVFALFESAIDAVRCALALLDAQSARADLAELRLRVGVHLGEVVFQDEHPFGEALAIAARLESLAPPGAVLVSAPVVDAVAARVAARFDPNGAPPMKNIPRRIETFIVRPLAHAADHTVASETSDLDEAPAGEASSALTAATPDEMIEEVKPVDLNQLTDLRAFMAAAQAQAARADAATSAPDPASDGEIAALSDILSNYVGEPARRIVAREAQATTEFAALAERLAATIVEEADRAAFRARVDVLAHARRLFRSG